MKKNSIFSIIRIILYVTIGLISYDLLVNIGVDGDWDYIYAYQNADKFSLENFALFGANVGMLSLLYFIALPCNLIGLDYEGYRLVLGLILIASISFFGSKNKAGILKSTIILSVISTNFYTAVLLRSSQKVALAISFIFIALSIKNNIKKYILSALAILSSPNIIPLLPIVILKSDSMTTLIKSIKRLTINKSLVLPSIMISIGLISSNLLKEIIDKFIYNWQDTSTNIVSVFGLIIVSIFLIRYLQKDNYIVSTILIILSTVTVGSYRIIWLFYYLLFCYYVSLETNPFLTKRSGDLIISSTFIIWTIFQSYRWIILCQEGNFPWFAGY